MLTEPHAIIPATVRIVSIAGRVKNKRTSGAKLMFYDLFADGVRVQVMCQAQHHEDGDFEEEHAKYLKSC